MAIIDECIKDLTDISTLRDCEYLSALEELSRLRDENETLRQMIKDLEEDNQRFKAQLIKSAEEIGRLTSGADVETSSGQPEEVKIGANQKKQNDTRFDRTLYRRGRPPVSDAVKKEILALRAGGYSIRRIASNVGLSYGVCQKIIKDNK